VDKEKGGDDGGDGNKQMDVLHALLLSLNEDGILLKNELYFGVMRGLFKHTLQYVYTGVPLLCSQAMVIGSNGINFMTAANEDEGGGGLTNHVGGGNGGTAAEENLLVIDDPIDTEKHVGFYHDNAVENENVKRLFCKRRDMNGEDLEEKKVPL